MRSLTLPSPAKVNLYLRVLGREANGYHRLLTLFHRISLRDTLRLTPRANGFSLTCSDPGLSTGEDNLVTRAYRLLQRKFPRIGGVSVRLTKRIPIGGGLGGGSSNAATFLLGMKKIYNLRISFSDLVVLGKSLGADVPFFLYNVNQAIGKGRGDRIIPKPAKARHHFLLLIDNKGLSTKKVYQNLPKHLPAVFLTKVSHAVTMLCVFLDRRDYRQAAKILQNDLELPAFRLRPSIQRKINQIKKFSVRTVGMSGSGPSVFAIFSSEREAESLVQKLKNRPLFKTGIVCHSF